MLGVGGQWRKTDSRLSVNSMEKPVAWITTQQYRSIDLKPIKAIKTGKLLQLRRAKKTEPPMSLVFWTLYRTGGTLKARTFVSGNTPALPHYRETTPH